MDAPDAPTPLSLHEFVALLQLEDPVELADGLKRCRDAIARGDDSGGGALAAAYLAASPEATEVMSAWDSAAPASAHGGRGVVNRLSTLVLDLLSVLLAFASDGSEGGDGAVEPLARLLLRTRARTLSTALASTAPRAVRCTLKLLTSIVRLGGTFPRDVLRRVAIPAPVIQALATQRHDTVAGEAAADASAPGAARAAAAATRGGMRPGARGGIHRGGLSKRAARAASTGHVAADAHTRAKHLYLHGRAGDDVRSAYVRFLCALLSCGAPEVVREAVMTRLRGSVSALVWGLLGDTPGVIVSALGALGDAFLLANALPHRVISEVMNAATLVRLAALYGAAPAGVLGEEAGAEASIRPALHALLVGLSTGSLLTGVDIAAAEAGVPFNTPEWDTHVGRIAATSGVARGGAAKRPRSWVEGAEGLSGAGAEGPLQEQQPRGPRSSWFSRRGRGHSRAQQTLLPCVFAPARAREDLAGAGGDVRALLSLGVGGGSGGGAFDDDGTMLDLSSDSAGGAIAAEAAKDPDADDARLARSLAALTGVSQEEGGVSADPAVAAIAAASHSGTALALGSAGVQLGALAFALRLKASEDPLQRDALLRLFATFPPLVPAYLSAFPYSPEPRPVLRWRGTISFLSLLLSSRIGDGTVACGAVAPSRSMLVRFNEGGDGGSLPPEWGVGGGGGGGSLPPPSTAQAHTDMTAHGALTDATAMGGDINAVLSMTLVRGGFAHPSISAAAAPRAPHKSLISSIAVLGDASDGSIVGGVPLSSLLRAILPPSLSRSLFTRGLLHPHAGVVLHTLHLLDAVLARAARAMREVCDIEPLVFAGAAGIVRASDDSSWEREDGSTGSDANIRRDAINAALVRARASRASTLTRAVLAVCPDVQAVIAVRARAALLLAASDLSSIETSFVEDSGATADGPGSIAVGGLSLPLPAASKGGVPPAPTSASVLTPAECSHALTEGMLRVLCGYTTLSPPTGLSATPGGSAFDFMRLVPTVPDALRASPQGVQLALLRLLCEMPPPTHSTLVSAWLTRHKSEKSALSGAVAAAAVKTATRLMAEGASADAPTQGGAPPVPSVEAGAIAHVLDTFPSPDEAHEDALAALTPHSPFTTLLELASDVTASTEVRSSVLVILRRCAACALDPAATLSASAAATAGAEGALPAASPTPASRAASSSGSVASFSATAAAAAMDEALEIAEGSGAGNNGVPVFRRSPLLCAVSSGGSAEDTSAHAIAVFAALDSSVTEADVWMGLATGAGGGGWNVSTHPAGAAAVHSLPTALLHALIWSSVNDGLPSPLVALAAAAASSGTPSSSSSRLACEAAPFTLRAWLALAVSAATIAEDACSNNELDVGDGANADDVRLQSMLSAARSLVARFGLGQWVRAGGEGASASSQGGHLSSLGSVSAGASSANRSAMVSAASARTARLILHASALAFVTRATTAVLAALPPAEAASVRAAVSDVAASVSAVLSPLVQEQPQVPHKSKKKSKVVEVAPRDAPGLELQLSPSATRVRSLLVILTPFSAITASTQKSVSASLLAPLLHALPAAGDAVTLLPSTPAYERLSAACVTATMALPPLPADHATDSEITDAWTALALVCSLHLGGGASSSLSTFASLAAHARVHAADLSSPDNSFIARLPILSLAVGLIPGDGQDVAALRVLQRAQGALPPSSAVAVHVKRILSSSSNNNTAMDEVSTGAAVDAQSSLGKKGSGKRQRSSEGAAVSEAALVATQPPMTRVAASTSSPATLLRGIASAFLSSLPPDLLFALSGTALLDGPLGGRLRRLVLTSLWRAYGVVSTPSLIVHLPCPAPVDHMSGPAPAVRCVLTVSAFLGRLATTGASGTSAPHHALRLLGAILESLSPRGHLLPNLTAAASLKSRSADSTASLNMGIASHVSTSALAVALSQPHLLHLIRSTGTSSGSSTALPLNLEAVASCINAAAASWAGQVSSPAFARLRSVAAPVISTFLAAVLRKPKVGSKAASTAPTAPPAAWAVLLRLHTLLTPSQQSMLLEQCAAITAGLTTATPKMDESAAKNDAAASSAYPLSLLAALLKAAPHASASRSSTPSLALLSHGAKTVEDLIHACSTPALAKENDLSLPDSADSAAEALRLTLAQSLIAEASSGGRLSLPAPKSEAFVVACLTESAAMGVPPSEASAALALALVACGVPLVSSAGQAALASILSRGSALLAASSASPSGKAGGDDNSEESGCEDTSATTALAAPIRAAFAALPILCLLSGGGVVGASMDLILSAASCHPPRSSGCLGTGDMQVREAALAIVEKRLSASGEAGLADSLAAFAWLRQRCSPQVKALARDRDTWTPAFAAHALPVMQLVGAHAVSHLREDGAGGTLAKAAGRIVSLLVRLAAEQFAALGGVSGGAVLKSLAMCEAACSGKSSASGSALLDDVVALTHSLLVAPCDAWWAKAADMSRSRGRRVACALTLLVSTVVAPPLQESSESTVAHAAPMDEDGDDDDEIDGDGGGAQTGADEGGAVPRPPRALRAPSLLSLPGFAVLAELACIRAKEVSVLTRVTQGEGAASSISAAHTSLISHPSFPHLLLRDRWAQLRLTHLASLAVATTTSSTAPLGAGDEMMIDDDVAQATARAQGGVIRDTLLLPLYFPSHELSIQHASLPHGLLPSEGGASALAAAIDCGLPLVADSPRLSAARLVLRLLRWDPRGCTLPPLLPAFAAAYGASLSTTDRTLRAILSVYESRGSDSSPTSIGFAFSAAALPHIQWAALGWVPVTTTSDTSNATPSLPRRALPSHASAVPEMASVFDWLFAGDREGAAAAEAAAAAGGARRGGRGNGRGGRGGFRGGGGARWGSGRQPKVDATRSAPLPPLFALRTSLAGWQMGLQSRRVAATVASFPALRGLAPEAADARPLPFGCAKLCPLSPLVASEAVSETACDAPAGSQQGTDALAASTHATLRAATRALCYDPSWVLLALLHALSAASPPTRVEAAVTDASGGAGSTGGAVVASGGAASASAPPTFIPSTSRALGRPFASSGALALTLSALSSAVPVVRRAAYSLVGAYFEGALAHRIATAGHGGRAGLHAASTATSTFPEVPQLALLLSVLKATVATTGVSHPRLPSLLSTWAAEAVHVLLRPSHALYPLVNRFLLRRSGTGGFDVGDVPLLYSCLGGGDAAASMVLASAPMVAAAAEAAGSSALPRSRAYLLAASASGSSNGHSAWWLLRSCLCRGIQSVADVAAMRKRHGFHLLLGAATAALDLAAAAPRSGGSGGSVASTRARTASAISIVRAALQVLLSSARLTGPVPRLPGHGFARLSRRTGAVEAEEEEDVVAAAAAAESAASGRAIVTGGIGDDNESIDGDDAAADEDDKKRAMPLVESLVRVLLTEGESFATAGDLRLTPTPPSKRLATASYLRRSCAAMAWAGSIWASVTAAASPSAPLPLSLTPSSAHSSLEHVFIGIIPLDIALAAAELITLLAASSRVPSRLRLLLQRASLYATAGAGARAAVAVDSDDSDTSEYESSSADSDDSSSSSDSSSDSGAPSRRRALKSVAATRSAGRVMTPEDALRDISLRAESLASDFSEAFTGFSAVLDGAAALCSHWHAAARRRGDASHLHPTLSASLAPVLAESSALLSSVVMQLLRVQEDGLGGAQAQQLRLLNTAIVSRLQPAAAAAVRTLGKPVGLMRALLCAQGGGLRVAPQMSSCDSLERCLASWAVKL